MADVTRCKHSETGHEAELPTDALVAFKARGWEPISDSRPEQVAEQERVDAENAAASPGPVKAVKTAAPLKPSKS